ncbi:sigma-70 family RNA polymerase sigma factor [Psychroserpens sp. AS72]|uniref:RNA polymerase sigma factor n=1 Tax=Psychroserpens sp. AS72 TaxID=3135775 RepID=UPI00317BC1D3
MDLEEIIKACKRNKLKAQSQLYKRYKDDLYILCLKYCKNKEEAQDNLQDSFLDIFDNIKAYKGTGSFEGWMKRITIYKAIDKYKKTQPINIEINDAILEDTSIDSEIIEVIPLDDILKYIQELPTQYRMVFNLYELDQYSHKEIAQMLNISENTSKSNLHRAKHILKQKILNVNPLISKTTINK